MKKGSGGAISRSLIGAVYETVIAHKLFFAIYEKITLLLGLLSVPLAFSFLTYFFAAGGVPTLLVPDVASTGGSALLIGGFVMALVIHEASHLVVLTNHGVRATSVGISLAGVFGAYVQADMNPETYHKIKVPFFSCGVGSGLLAFLILLALGLSILPSAIPAAVAFFWFTVLNALPAPLMDGGKIFESGLEIARLERRVYHVSVLIIASWIAAIVYHLVV